MEVNAERRARVEAATAITVAALLTLAWAAADWARLSALILPDPDDMMRLAQIRDWIGGQAFADLTQHRLGGGLAMHWSRLPDLVPAALILMLEPMAGRHGAELAAVVLWPAMLFAAALTLLAGIARRLNGGAAAAGMIALVVGALAYPATGFFMPGRIDHHGLQLVLLLIAARAMLKPDTASPERAGAAPVFAWPTQIPSPAGAGVAAGLAIAVSLAIGLESAPLCALVLAVLALRWAVEGGARGTMLAACGLALGGGVALAALLLAPRIWVSGLCDAFTPPVAWLGIVAGALLVGLGVMGRLLDRPARRFAALAAAAVAGCAAIPLLAPACLGGPYGAVPPLLRTLWLDHVAEAQSLFDAPPAVAFGYAGLMLAGLVATGARVVRGDRDSALLAWLALQLGAALLTCIQLRIAPFGAALAVPVLAGTIAAARARRRPLAVAGAWMVSAGILYPLAAGIVGAPQSAAARPPCLTPANLQRIAALGPGMIAAPLDMGAYLLRTPGQRTLAAPYHRGDAAMLAHYRLFLARANIAAATARRWNVRAIVYCPGWIGDLDPRGVVAPDSILGMAANGNHPGWTKPRHVSPDLVVLEIAR